MASGGGGCGGGAGLARDGRDDDDASLLDSFVVGIGAALRSVADADVEALYDDFCGDAGPPVDIERTAAESSATAARARDGAVVCTCCGGAGAALRLRDYTRLRLQCGPRLDDGVFCTPECVLGVARETLIRLGDGRQFDHVLHSVRAHCGYAAAPALWRPGQTASAEERAALLAYSTAYAEIMSSVRAVGGGGDGGGVGSTQRDGSVQDGDDGVRPHKRK